MGMVVVVEDTATVLTGGMATARRPSRSLGTCLRSWRSRPRRMGSRRAAGCRRCHRVTRLGMVAGSRGVGTVVEEDRVIGLMVVVMAGVEGMEVDTVVEVMEVDTVVVGVEEEAAAAGDGTRSKCLSDRAGFAHGF